MFLLSLSRDLVSAYCLTPSGECQLDIDDDDVHFVINQHTYLYLFIAHTMIYKALHRKLKIEQQDLAKTGGELRGSARVSSSCHTCGTHRVQVSFHIFIYFYTRFTFGGRRGRS